MKWSKTHPTDLMKKKFTDCNFQYEPKPLHTNVRIIGTFICMEGIGKKMKITAWEFFFQKILDNFPIQGFYKLESQGKPYQIQAKSGKSGKVRESQGYLKISE